MHINEGKQLYFLANTVMLMFYSQSRIGDKIVLHKSITYLQYHMMMASDCSRMSHFHHSLWLFVSIGCFHQAGASHDR